jgi:hypothetical protein
MVDVRVREQQKRADVLGTPSNARNRNDSSTWAGVAEVAAIDQCDGMAVADQIQVEVGGSCKNDIRRDLLHAPSHRPLPH